MSTTALDGQFDRKLTRRILWKLDIHVLPPLAFLWLANFIDRANIGNARIAGLERDLHLHGTEFNTALAIFYVSYIIVEVPSNWVLKKFKPSRWLPFLVILWGTVTTLSGLVHNYSGLLAVRFFLGLCEGGLLPGIMLYLSTLYKPHELQQRVGIFYASASLSGAFGGLLATAIVKMDGVGNVAGWKWIFILEGMATVLIALVSMIFLPADLQTAKFFSEEERAFALARLHRSFGVTTTAPLSEPAQRITNSDADPEKSSEGKVEVHNAEQLVEPQVWMTAVSYMGIIISLYSFSLFLPTIVAGLGYSGGEAQLHTVPPYVPAVVLTVLVAIASDRLRLRGPFILLFLPITIAGEHLSTFIACQTRTNEPIRVYPCNCREVFLIATGIYPCGPCILSILPNNNAGHYKKATTVALQLAVANCGGFVATFIYDSSQAPTYIRGHSITLGCVCLAWVAMFCNVTYCFWENKARAEGRRQDNLTKYQELWDSGKTRAPIGDRHPDFRFTP
ncbi:MFS general substrate transporter [Fomes fomentarius]|nr:MFS general substrate transporter [Fomes fomentarius]